MLSSMNGATSLDRKGLQRAAYTGTMIVWDLNIRKSENKLKLLVIRRIKSSTFE